MTFKKFLKIGTSEKYADFCVRVGNWRLSTVRKLRKRIEEVKTKRVDTGNIVAKTGSYQEGYLDGILFTLRNLKSRIFGGNQMKHNIVAG